MKKDNLPLNIEIILIVLLIIIVATILILANMKYQTDDYCCKEQGGKIQTYECANCGMAADCSNLKCGDYCESDNISFKVLGKWDNCSINLVKSANV